MCTRPHIEKCAPLLFFSRCLTNTHVHTPSIAGAIYSHLSHTGKCIHVPRFPISLLGLSIFSHTHSPKQSPSITTSLNFFASLSPPLYLSLLYRKPFLSTPTSPPTYISLLSSRSPDRQFLSLSDSASHPSPRVLLGDQSSSSQGCQSIGSGRTHIPTPTHTHARFHHNEWTSNARIYIWSRQGGQSQSPGAHMLGCNHTVNTNALNHMAVAPSREQVAHHFL